MFALETRRPEYGLNQTTQHSRIYQIEIYLYTVQHPVSSFFEDFRTYFAAQPYHSALNKILQRLRWKSDRSHMLAKKTNIYTFHRWYYQFIWHIYLANFYVSRGSRTIIHKLKNWEMRLSLYTMKFSDMRLQKNFFLHFKFKIPKSYFSPISCMYSSNEALRMESQSGRRERIWW